MALSTVSLAEISADQLAKILPDRPTKSSCQLILFPAYLIAPSAASFIKTQVDQPLKIRLEKQVELACQLALSPDHLIAPLIISLADLPADQILVILSKTSAKLLRPPALFPLVTPQKNSILLQPLVFIFYLDYIKDIR